MSTISKRKHKRFDIEAYYRNKSRTFQSVPKLFKIKSERFGVFLKFKKPNQNENEFIFLSDRNVSIHLCFRGIKTELLYVLKNYIRPGPKRFKLRRNFFKTKQNFYLFQKKFENRPEQKLLDQIFLVLIENVLFRSRILFLK